MAIFNDLKKILFGAKAVGESAAERTVEAGKNAAENAAETGGELWERTKERVGQIGAVILDQAGTAAEKAGEFVENVGGKVQEAKEVAKDKLHNLTGNAGQNDHSDISGQDVMDDILSETKTPPPANIPEDEVLDLSVFPTLPVGESRQTELPENQPFNSENADETSRAALPENPLFTAENQPAAATTTASASAENASAAIENPGSHPDDVASRVGKKVMETGSHLAEKLGEKSEQVGGYLFEKGGEALEKAKGIAEDVGSVVLQKGGEAFERAKDLAGDLGEKFRQAKDDLFAKAQAEAEKEGDTDSLIEKAKNLSQKLEDKITGNNAQFADKPMDLGGSELKKHGGFWEKAERFAQGDYHNQGARLKPGEVKIEEETLELKPIKKSGEKGEGLIDDAIIDDEK